MLKVILDTDIGSDCDDAGALRILHSLADQGLCEIEAIVSSTSRRDGVAIIDAINRYCGRVVPVGMVKSKKICDASPFGMYSRAVSWVYENSYRHSDAEDACVVLRRTLASATEPVRLITIGAFVNIADLMKSAPDEFSPLNGMQLIEEKVLDMYSMAGLFRQPIGYNGFCSEKECNVMISLEDTLTVFREFPKPIIYSPFEVGCQILIGKELLKMPDNPVKMAYYVHNGGAREAWDPVTVYAAVCGTDMFRVENNVHVNITDSGVTKYIPNGKDSLLVDFCSAEAREQIINELETLVSKEDNVCKKRQ